MSSSTPSKKELVEKLSHEGRRLGLATIFFHQAIAEKAGLASTDHKYLDLLAQEGPMTAGRLAEITGLTTGAVTGVINRLEKAELVGRERDPDDKRKVIIVPNYDEAYKKLGPLFEPVSEKMRELNSQYSSNELEIILNYFKECSSFFFKQAQQLRKD